MILAGDIGGTKCNLALYDLRPEGHRQIIKCRFESREFSSFDEIIEKFLLETKNETRDARAGAIQAAFLSRLWATCDLVSLRAASTRCT